MKQKSAWHCSSCGHKQLRWSGQCPTCLEWNTLQEEVEFIAKSPGKAILPPKGPQKPLPLKEIPISQTRRVPTSLHEFDRAIGGGIVPGSLTLIGGDPGIGKSTISLQLANSVAKGGLKVLYVTGEESLEQASLRAKRLGIDSENLLFYQETEVTHILKAADELQPDLMIIDSIQIVYRSELQSAPGSVTQVRESTTSFMQCAKTRSIATILIGHVTKSGDIAGPKVLEHLVDTVLHFEGDKQQNLRLLRVLKNRFGPTDEIAVFQMMTEGLREIPNPSQLFLDERMMGRTGSVVIPTLEGSRPLLIEVQALVTDTFYPNPSRRSTGLDPNRLALLLAVLEKRAKLHLYQCDVFVAVTGGIRINEPACDLGVLLAIASSFSNKVFHPETLVIGEVGLGGEVRAVQRIESRIKEGIQLGFSRCLLPKRNLKGLPKELASKISLVGVEWVEEVMDELSR